MVEQENKQEELVEKEPGKTTEELQKEYDLKLISIYNKIRAGKELSPEEQYFWTQEEQIQEEERIQQQNQEVQAELAEQQAKQDQARQDFEQAPKEQKMSSKEKGVRIKGKGGKVKRWLWNRKAKKAVKKGGSLILKAYKDSSLELVFSKKPVRFVEFKGKTEQGEETNYITRITKTKHRLSGTSVPIHVCLEGIAENMNLYEGAETNLSADYVNKWGSGLFHSGILKGMAMKDQAGIGGSLQNAVPLLLFINIGVMIIVVYLMFELWGIVADMAAAMGV